MDRDEISRERRRQRLSERLGHQGRKGEDHEENEGKDNNTSRWKERNQRYSKSNILSNNIVSFVKVNPCEF